MGETALSRLLTHQTWLRALLLGWPKGLFGFAVRCYRKTQTHILANPIDVASQYLHRQASQSFWNILPGASKFPGLLSLSPSLPLRGPIYNSSYIHNLSELRHPLENYWAVEKLPSWPLCSNSRLHINTQVGHFIF